METVRVIYHHEGDGWWAESPDVDGWSAAGDTYAEVAKLAEEGIPFALGRDGAVLEHFVPVGERIAA
jgi:predicted RNase H-like HicB family nuclease